MLLNKLIKITNKILTNLTIFLLKIRQKTLSTDKGILSFWLKGKVCVHQPHCSQYCIESLKIFGFFRGIKYCFERVTSCHPFGKENKFFLGDKVYDPVMYKVVFFSSAPIGIPFLEELFRDKRFEIVGVVTTPPKPAGRGLKISPTKIQQYVENLGKKNLLQIPEKLRGNQDFEDWLRSKEPDFIVVISYGKIIPESILDIPNIAPVNIHGSLLPKYRGASPIQSVLLDGERQTGITLIKMTPKLDAGDIIGQIKFDIPFSWTAKDIIDKMVEIGPGFTNDVLFKYAKGEIKEVQQDENQVSRYYKIKKEDGLINPFEDSLDSIWRKYKAFVLWPRIFFNVENLGKKIFKITKLDIDETKFDKFKNDPLIKIKDGKWFLNEAVKNIKIRPEGKKDLSWEEFLRGYVR